MFKVLRNEIHIGILIENTIRCVDCFLSFFIRFSDGYSEEIRKLASNLLAELLREIKANGVNYASVMHILVDHSTASGKLHNAVFKAGVRVIIHTCYHSFVVSSYA